MKTRVYLFLGKIVALTFMFGVGFISVAQPPAGPPLDGDTDVYPCWNPDCVPIDGGVGFLIAAGAVLGIKKIKNHKKQSRK
jgi:hypothetical protein